MSSTSQRNTKKMSSDHQPLLGATTSVTEPKAKFFQLAKEVVANAAKGQAWLVIQAGLLGTVITVYYALFTHDVILFTGHPIFNLLGLFALGNGIALVQPAPLSTAHKSVGGTLHGILNLVSTLLFVTGFSIIFYNKYAHNAEHFTSWHATFGLLTYAFLVVILLFGSAIFWLPETLFGSVNKAKSFYKYHRLAGFSSLLLITVTISLAIPSDYNQNVLHINEYALYASIASFVGGLFYQLKIAKVKVW